MLFYLNKNDIIQNSQANKIFISFKKRIPVFFLIIPLKYFKAFFWVIYTTIYKKLFLNYLYIYIFIENSFSFYEFSKRFCHFQRMIHLHQYQVVLVHMMDHLWKNLLIHFLYQFLSMKNYCQYLHLLI